MGIRLNYDRHYASSDIAFESVNRVPTQRAPMVCYPCKSGSEIDDTAAVSSPSAATSAVSSPPHNEPRDLNNTTWHVKIVTISSNGEKKVFSVSVNSTATVIGLMNQLSRTSGMENFLSSEPLLQFNDNLLEKDNILSDYMVTPHLKCVFPDEQGPRDNDFDPF